MTAAVSPQIETGVKLQTWFGLGGPARRFARPRTIDELRACLELDPALRIVGDGANLLVPDEGVSELVVSLSEGGFSEFEIGLANEKGHALVRAGAGVHLFKLINATVDAGLSGLENLAGIPASVGGATMMNAGGKYGAIGDYITSVTLLTHGGELQTLRRNQIEFTYRHCSLFRQRVIVTSVEFRLKRADPAAVKAKLKEVTEFKKASQPLSASSAGCCFKNPTLTEYVEGVGTPGTRVSAGMLIDRAGCKGLAKGGAVVSDQHANFIVAREGCTAADVVAVMAEVQARVAEAFGVRLEPEIVVWPAPGEPAKAKA